MSHDIDILLNKIRELENKNKFVNHNFKNKIEDVVTNFFPKLNQHDISILHDLTTYVVDLISKKLSFDNNNNDYYDQWTQNNNRDIKGVILLLLPFIDDKNNSYLLKKITDLNQLLYSQNGKKFIPNSIKNEERNNTFLSTHFEFGNMGIGLLNSNSENLLDLYPNNNKLIYDIIYHNFFGLLRTLEIMNGKYYVNWFNISPLNLENYYDSKIFEATKDKFVEFKKIFVETTEASETTETSETITINHLEYEKNMMIDYSGLWIGNFYNIIRINYFEQAKKIKWLFFPYSISEQNNFYLIQGLNKVLDLDKIIDSKCNNYDDLLEEEQLSFKNNFKIVINNLSLNNSIITNVITIDFEIIKYLIIYLVNNYSDQKKLPSNNKKKFELSNEDESKDIFGQEDTKTVKRLKNQDIVEYLNELYNNSIGHVWNFLKESIDMLINTSYGKFLIKENKIVDTFYYEPFNSKFKEGIDYKDHVEKKLNLKNIYNISKSLSHENIEFWTLLDENYISLSSRQRFEYLLKITDNQSTNTWIKLNSNLRMQMQYPFDYNQEMEKIINAFKNTILILVFEELVSNGLINEFRPNLKITNKILLPKDTSSKKKKLKELFKTMFDDNKEAWLDSYYYLTNDKFKNLGKIRVDKSENTDPNNKYKEQDYFDFTKDQEWPLFYAMDWISQISFFQHYIYHQVLYVTGATGQGKSTQVPKLLLYALKAIDNKSNSKVVCTQPRIPPTVGNATRISEELGVPIEQTTNNSMIKTKTNNYWVQFKHQFDKHTNDKKLHSNLKIMTDGSLLEELKSNPTMFKTIETKDKEKKFINENIYDIIIVDESHEHGVNMDLIITLSKQVCYFNNKIRLIIVSATMDDDEPIYRRYFSSINDNLLYPLKYHIEYPLIDKKIMLKSIYMDRRYHISPPGETTQYRIDEFYLDYDIIADKIDIIAAKAQELGYQKILEICNKSTNGEILFFANGQNEILKATEYLNSILPPGNIAIPYFAALNEIYKEIISKIDIKISQIKNKRENIHKEWGTNFIEDPTVTNGIYKRAIIIATNVAEASVTIPRLTYVVDNGYSKVKVYDRDYNISKLEVQKISESSRLQRKGRIGRVKDGSVYYMYKKDARKDIKTKYKITQEDLSSTILGLLTFKNIEDIKKNDFINFNKLIISNDINPNMLDGLLLKDSVILTDHYTFKSGLYDIYTKNYLFTSYSLDHPDHINIYGIFFDTIESQQMSRFFCVFDNGQLFWNLLDLYGEFYLIHPFEENIKRNVLNKIIEYNNKKINMINIKEHSNLISYLFSTGLIIDYNANSLYNSEIEISASDNKWVKTELGQKVSQIISKFEETTISDAITLIAAKAMGCFTEILEIKTLLEIIQFDLTKLAFNDKKWNKFNSIYKKPTFNSDIIFLYEIIQKVKSHFIDSFTFITNQSKTKVMLERDFSEKLNKFKKLIRKNNEIPYNFNGELWNKLKNSQNIGELQLKYKDILKSDKSTINLIYKDSDEINNWAKSNYLNPIIISDLFKKLGKLYLNKIIFDNIGFLDFDNNFNTNYMKLLTTGTIEEKIIRSYLYGRPNQFTYSITKSGPPCTLMNFIITPVKFKETLTILSNELVFYIKYDKKDGVEYETSILSKVDFDWIIPANPLLINPRLVPDIIRINNSELFYPNSEHIERIKRMMINNWDKNKILWYSEDVPIMKHFYNNISKILSTNNR